MEKPPVENDRNYILAHDIVLAALKAQLAEQAIELDIYKQRRQAYLDTLLPPPDNAA